MYQVKLAKTITRLYRGIMLSLLNSVNKADVKELKKLDSACAFAERLRESVVKLASKADEIETQANVNYDDRAMEIRKAYTEILELVPE